MLDTVEPQMVVTGCGPFLQDRTSQSCDTLILEPTQPQHFISPGSPLCTPVSPSCASTFLALPFTSNVQSTYCCASVVGRQNESIMRHLLEVPQRTQLLASTVASLWSQLLRRWRQEDHLRPQVQDQPRCQLKYLVYHSIQKSLF